MGLDRTIRFTSAELPDWPAILVKLNELGISASLRMIDNLPAFQDEIPEPGWKELRVGFLEGMVTLRRGTNSFSCVVWGNAEGPLKRAWDALIWACAAASEGTIETPAGTQSAAEFASVSGLISA